nr:class I SAM-dependent methyltransferase [Kofleriaceae bacterium]
MTTPDPAAYWNGEGGKRWADGHAHMDATLAVFGTALLRAAAPQPGERCVDIGCGTGATTLELARRTGAQVVGVDVSQLLVELARTKLTVLSQPEVEFVVADAATFPFEPVHDVVFSRFGVMFFPDPVAAFTNIRRALAPDGRLTFGCWRSIADNAWAAGPLAAARPLLPEVAPPDPHAPGPFAFADDARVRDLLTRAGWRDIGFERFDATMDLGATVAEATAETLRIGPLARAAAELPADVRAAIAGRVADALASFEAGGRVAPPASIWLVTAR